MNLSSVVPPVKQTFWSNLMNFFCQHNNRTWVFKDEEGNYVRCLDCGKRIGHDLLAIQTTMRQLELA